MTEYIDKKQIRYHKERVLNRWAGHKHTDCDVTYKTIVEKYDIDNIPPADVIELKPILEEYEELVQTNPTSGQVDEFCIKTMRKILCDYYVEKI